MHKKPENFLKVPQYPGGREYFKQFIKKNLKYPEKALVDKIEGLVLLSADVTDRGEVQNIKVEKGIGFGCDEEAVRLLGMMKFGGVKNRGVRVKTHKSFKIEFKIPCRKGRTISYNIKKNIPTAPEKTPISYSYTITMGKNGNQ